MLAQGIEDLLIDRISRLRWLVVIAGASERGGGAVQAESAADYLLRCRLSGRSLGPRMVQLTLGERETGRLLWSRRFRVASLADEAAFTRMAEESVAMLGARIEVEQQLRAFDRGSGRMPRSSELLWRARWHMRRLTKEDAEFAADLLRKAAEENPSMGPAYRHLGSCLALSGRPAEGIPLLETALRLNPLDTEAFHQFGEMALARYMLGRHADAVVDADRALARCPAYFYAHVLKIAALAELDDREAELIARREFAAVKPQFDSDALEWLPFRDREWIARLRKALS